MTENEGAVRGQGEARKYFGDFTDREQVAREFAEGSGDRYGKPEEWTISPTFPADDDILLASYEIEGYEGSAYVLFRAKDGTLREVEAGHCSCNGLEGDWSHSGLVTPQSLALRLKDDAYFGGVHGDALAAYRRIVEQLLAAQPPPPAPSTPEEK